MRERIVEKSVPNKDIAPQTQVIGIGKWPGRKRPVLYVGNEFCATLVATFPNDEMADAFMDYLTDFFKVPTLDGS